METSSPHEISLGDTENQVPQILSVVLKYDSMVHDLGPIVFGRIMKRLYNDGRLKGTFPALLVGPLYAVCSEHTPSIKFFLPPLPGSNELLPISDGNVRVLLARIVDGFFRYKDHISHRDGFDALVDSIKEIERNNLDLHDALFGSPYVRPHE